MFMDNFTHGVTLVISQGEWEDPSHHPDLLTKLTPWVKLWKKLNQEPTTTGRIVVVIYSG